VHALGDQWVHVEQRFHAGAPISAGPLVTASGHLFLGSHDGTLHGLSPGGGFLWSYTVEGALVTALTSDGTRIYAASSFGKFYAIAEDGGPRWVFSSPVTPDTPLVYSSRRLVFFGQRDSLFSVSVRAGLIWRAALSAPIADGPLVDLQGRAWLVTTDGRLHRIQSPGVRKSFVLPKAQDYQIVGLPREALASHETPQGTPMATAPSASTPTGSIDGQTILVRVGHALLGLDVEGRELFRVEGVQYASPVTGQAWVGVSAESSPLSAGGRLAVATRIDDRTETSQLVWYQGARRHRAVQLPHRVSAPPLVDGEFVFVPGAQGELTVQRASDPYSCQLGAAPLFQPVKDPQGRVWIASGDGRLFAIHRSHSASP
jgi:hypothetical protein